MPNHRPLERSVLPPSWLHPRRWRDVAPLLAVMLAALSSTGDRVDALVCADASTFGAVPDDGLDDRAALQRALDAGGCIRLASGSYDVDTPVRTQASHPPAILVARPNTRVVGAYADEDGEVSWIRFRGDARGFDWRGVQLASGFRLERVGLSTAGLLENSTNEQTHVLRADGPVVGVTVTNVIFDHPRRGRSLAGDAIQLVGYAGRLIEDVEIDHVDFRHCDRSCVGFHSGVHRMRIHHSTFRDTGDQDVDGEGTGDVVDLEVDNNVMMVGSSPGSSVGVQIQLATGVRFHHNKLIGRGIDVYSSRDVQLYDDVVEQAIPGAAGVVVIRKDSSAVVIRDEHFVRAASAGPGNVIRFVQHSSGSPSQVSISDSVLEQNTEGHVVVATGVVGLDVTRTRIFAAVAEGSPWRALQVLGGTAAVGVTTPVRTTDVTLDDVVVHGQLEGVLLVSGSYGGTGTISLSGVRAQDVAEGLTCENVRSGARVTGPVTYETCDLPPPVCPGLVP